MKKMKKMIGFVWSEDYFEFNEKYGCDKDILVELIVCGVKMNNWWVVGEKGFDVRGVIEKIEERVRDELSDVSDDCFGGRGDYMLSFESSNIMSEEFSIGMCEEGGEVYRMIEELSDENNDNEEMIDRLIEKCVNIEMSEEIGKRVEKIIEGFGNEEGGWMREIVGEKK